MNSSDFHRKTRDLDEIPARIFSPLLYQLSYLTQEAFRGLIAPSTFQQNARAWSNTGQMA
jgi:hypothetical protein